jgi:glucans biosynthesis protein C
MTTIADQKTERQYYIDWLRIMLILSVFLYHIGMIFNPWPWHIKNSEQFGGLLCYIMNFLHSWRMPLLFMLSGAGTYFALGKRTSGQYLWERFRRLVIPLAAGIFILVPVQVYIERIDQYSTLPEYYHHMFEGIYPEGNFSWHHLWFIAYLFVISLFISPFLNFLRGRRFQSFRSRIEKRVTKPLALNIFIIPLILSQIILRPFFETETNDLINDWASFSYYIIFFLAGFTLLASGNITEAMRKYRLWYLAEVCAVTIVMFTVPAMARSEESGEIIHDVASIFLAWSCAMTATGFAKQYFNRNSTLRRLGNEAIYPFYLLHQPIIVVTGYFTINLGIAVVWKVAIVLLSSFTLTTAIYWFLIRPFNLFRVIFGMKKLEKENREMNKPQISHALEPVIAKDEMCLSA